MQVVARAPSGAAHETDNLALLHRIALMPVNTGKVCVACLEAEAVGNDHRPAISRNVAGESNRAACGGVYGRRIFGGHIQPGMKGASAAYGVYPISEPVGYAVSLFERCNRRHKPENILLSADDMPDRGDLSEITCRLQHLDHQCALFLRRPCQTKQEKHTQAKAPTHSRCRCSPSRKERGDLRFSRLSRYGKTCRRGW